MIYIAEYLGIKFNPVYAHDYNFQGQKSDLVLDMCKTLKVEKYWFGSQCKDYADVQSFTDAGIEVEFQDYKPIEYPQLWGEFIPDMCVLDMIFNVAPEDRIKVLIGG